MVQVWRVLWFSKSPFIDFDVKIDALRLRYTLRIKIEKYKLQASTARTKQARASTARASTGAYCGASVERVGFSKSPFIDFDAKLTRYECIMHT